MENSETFFGYTFPENQLYGVYTQKTVKLLWERSLALSFKRVKGFLKLGNHYSTYRLEKACKRACFYGEPSIKKITMILELGLDRLSLHPETDIEGQYRFDF